MLIPVLGPGLHNNLSGAPPTLTQFLHQHLEMKVSRRLSLMNYLASLCHEKERAAWRSFLSS